MNKKNYIVLGILLVLVIAASGCTQNTGNNNSNASSTNSSSSGTVKAVISYSGSWNGGASGQFGYRSLSGTGDQTIDLGNVTGYITVNANKLDGSSGPLTVSITKDGKTLGSQTTTAPYGGTSATAPV